MIIMKSYSDIIWWGDNFFKVLIANALVDKQWLTPLKPSYNHSSIGWFCYRCIYVVEEIYRCIRIPEEPVRLTVSEIGEFLYRRK